MKFTDKQKNIFQDLEKQIIHNFSKIRNGDRTALHTGKFFEINHLANLPESDFYAIRKYLKETIVSINKDIEKVEDNSKLKDLMLKMTLYDQLKYDVKKLERQSEQEK